MSAQLQSRPAATAPTCRRISSLRRNWRKGGASASAPSKPGSKGEGPRRISERGVAFCSPNLRLSPGKLRTPTRAARLNEHGTRTPMNDVPSLFLTTQELASRRRVSIRTVERWRSDGSGPPFQRRGNSASTPSTKSRPGNRRAIFEHRARTRGATQQKEQKMKRPARGANAADLGIVICGTAIDTPRSSTPRLKSNGS